MADLPPAVVDASIVGRWFLPDEDYVAEALALQSAFARGGCSWQPPRLVVHELASAMSKSVHRTDRPRRPGMAEAWQAVERFQALGLELVPNGLIMPAAFGIANLYNCTYYDALYLAVALRLNAPFFHADARLRLSLRGRFPLERWIAGYVPPTS